MSEFPHLAELHAHAVGFVLSSRLHKDDVEFVCTTLAIPPTTHIDRVRGCAWGETPRWNWTGGRQWPLLPGVQPSSTPKPNLVDVVHVGNAYMSGFEAGRRSITQGDPS